MASESPRKRLREEVTCPICLEFFREPVTLACEHNFCRSCILQSLAKSPTSTLCPLCKRTFHREDLKPNYSMAGFSQLINLLRYLEEADGRGVCQRHQEPLTLFCKDSEVLLCTSCEKEHQDHNIVPVEEAAQELKKQMAKERQKAAIRFHTLWPFLKKQEVRTLTRMKRVEKQMARKRELHMDRLNQQLSSLEDLIQEMEKKRELPATQLLQDVGSVLKRSRQKVTSKYPSYFLPVLYRKVSAFTDSHAILERAMKEFEDLAASCF
ncbi:UNVERIFIED_CONTAM: hypothetical protein K2H54_060729 [Gekko kuhli]